MGNNPVQQRFNIIEVVLCGQPDFHKKLIGAFFHISGIVTLPAQRFKDVPKLGQGVRKFFIDPGQNTEPAIFKTVRAFGGDPQNLFPPGKAHVSSGGNELIIKKIIRGIPCLFNFRLFAPHDPLKLRIITNDIGKIINQFAFHAPAPLIR